MSDILTITLNPTVDFSTSAKRVRPDRKIRCDAAMRDPGGGGVNVARAIHILGGDARAFAAVGGHMGQILLSLLGREGVQVHPFDIPGETRQSMAVTERRTGQQYRFVMPGPIWDASLVKCVLDEIHKTVPKDGYVVLSGSNPPGVPDDFPALLERQIYGTGARLVVDTSGRALRQMVTGPANPPYLLRMDKAEAEELAGEALETVEALARFATHLVKRGVAQVIVMALGSKGSVLATGNERWHAAAADVPVRSKVGAGDSFVGALVLALSRGEAPSQALQKGAAAASAAVMTDATRLCPRTEAEALVGRCPLVRLE
ncbi:1-phosphofructokinase family hexose kinase [Profundibacter sp.]